MFYGEQSNSSEEDSDMELEAKEEVFVRIIDRPQVTNIGDVYPANIPRQ